MTPTPELEAAVERLKCLSAGERPAIVYPIEARDPANMDVIHIFDAFEHAADLRLVLASLPTGDMASRDHAPGEQRQAETETPYDTRFGPWRIWFDPPPIGTRNCDWHYQHEDAEPECPSWMYGHCASRNECIEEIITQYEERG